jgi:hypothetical protein
MGLSSRLRLSKRGGHACQRCGLFRVDQRRVRAGQRHALAVVQMVHGRAGQAQQVFAANIATNVVGAPPGAPRGRDPSALSVRAMLAIPRPAARNSTIRRNGAARVSSMVRSPVAGSRPIQAGALPGGFPALALRRTVARLHSWRLRASISANAAATTIIVCPSGARCVDGFAHEVARDAGGLELVDDLQKLAHAAGQARDRQHDQDLEAAAVAAASSATMPGRLRHDLAERGFVEVGAGSGSGPRRAPSRGIRTGRAPGRFAVRG